MTPSSNTLAGLSDSARLVRFVVTGVVNTAVGYGLYAAFLLAGCSPQTALTLAFAAGVSWNYMVHARYVFGTEGYRRFPAYAGVYLVLYVLNASALAMAIRAGVSPLLAQGVLAVMVAGLSFIALGYVLTGRLPGGRRTETRK